MFELQNQSALVKSFSPRGEKTGDPLGPGSNIEFEIKTTNEILVALGSQLRNSLYWKSEGTPLDQGSLDGIEPVSDVPNLRNPKLGGPLRLQHEFAGYTVRVSSGIGASKPIEIDSVELNKIRIWPQEGGTVRVMFRCQGHPDEKACGKLAHWVGKAVDLTLIPPAPDAQMDMDSES